MMNSIFLVFEFLFVDLVGDVGISFEFFLFKIEKMDV